MPPPPGESGGASFNALTSTSRVASALDTGGAPSSSTLNVTVRSAVDGSSLVSTYVTLRIALWYAARDAVPVNVTVPEPAFHDPVTPPPSANASTSSPAAWLPEIVTVACVRFALSASVIVSPPATVTALPFSTYATLPPPVVTSGASFTAVTVTPRVRVGLGSAPSFTVMLTVRVALDGFSLEFEYVTLRSALWYAATDALPDNVIVPVPLSHEPVMP